MFCSKGIENLDTDEQDYLHEIITGFKTRRKVREKNTKINEKSVEVKALEDYRTLLLNFLWAAWDTIEFTINIKDRKNQSCIDCDYPELVARFSVKICEYLFEGIDFVPHSSKLPITIPTSSGNPLPFFFIFNH